MQFISLTPTNRQMNSSLLQIERNTETTNFRWEAENKRKPLFCATRSKERVVENDEQNKAIIEGKWTEIAFYLYVEAKLNWRVSRRRGGGCRDRERDSEKGRERESSRNRASRSARDDIKIASKLEEKKWKKAKQIHIHFIRSVKIV